MKYGINPYWRLGKWSCMFGRLSKQVNQMVNKQVDSQERKVVPILLLRLILLRKIKLEVVL